MNLPKPVKAPSVDMEDVISQHLAQQDAWEKRAKEVQGAAAQAYSRLLSIAETSDTGQAGRCAQFIAATFNGHAYSFNLFDLRAVDAAISDDMLTSMDALRWGKADLFNLVPDGEKRIIAMIKVWGIKSRIAD